MAEDSEGLGDFWTGNDDWYEPELLQKMGALAITYVEFEECLPFVFAALIQNTDRELAREVFKHLNGVSQKLDCIRTLFEYHRSRHAWWSDGLHLQLLGWVSKSREIVRRRNVIFHGATELDPDTGQLLFRRKEQQPEHISVGIISQLLSDIASQIFLIPCIFTTLTAAFHDHPTDPITAIATTEFERILGRLGTDGNFLPTGDVST